MHHACPRCGSATTRRGCCTICARKENAQKNQRPTAEVYQSKRWRELRDQVLKRDGYRCQQCGAHPANHAGHTTPFVDANDPHAWDANGIVCLCATCNGREAGHRRHATHAPTA